MATDMNNDGLLRHFSSNSTISVQMKKIHKSVHMSTVALLCLVHISIAAQNTTEKLGIGGASARASVKFVSPAFNGIVIGDTVRLIVQCDSLRIVPVDKSMSMQLDVSLNDEPYPKEITWIQQGYVNRWVADVALAVKGQQIIDVEGVCGNDAVSRRIAFDNSVANNSIAVADLALTQFLTQNEPSSLSWTWREGILLYSLTRMAKKSSRAMEYLNYVKDYQYHHQEKGLPQINWPDSCPPALSALDLAIEYNDDSVMSNVMEVVQWIKTAPTNKLGTLDHPGTKLPESLIYPSSIWVDSLMMWVLPAMKYALAMGDAALLKFAVEQPKIFVQTLMNQETGLLNHAWNVQQDRLFPRRNVPWLRGNGWALLAMAHMLELLQGVENQEIYFAEIATLFVELAKSSLAFRQVSGYWDTVIAQPGYAYEESSGSALVAAAYAMGSRLGLLSEEYLALACDTFQSITARMKRRSGNGFTVEGISIGTNPSRKLGYKVVPKRPNISYGVGAFVLLADELSDVEFNGTLCLAER